MATFAEAEGEGGTTNHEPRTEHWEPRTENVEPWTAFLAAFTFLFPHRDPAV